MGIASPRGASPETVTAECPRLPWCGVSVQAAERRTQSAEEGLTTNRGQMHHWRMERACAGTRVCVGRPVSVGTGEKPAQCSQAVSSQKPLGKPRAS